MPNHHHHHHQGHEHKGEHHGHAKHDHHKHGHRQHEHGQRDIQGHEGPSKQHTPPQSSGRKKAVCIGINYIGHKNQLKGCINDARNMRDFLCKRYGYTRETIWLLADDSHTKPTRKNILKAMQWLTKDARSTDSLVLHYSGHGGQTMDTSGDENRDDGKDEVIYPLDWKTEGFITDDDMHRILVNPLPEGTRLTAIFDCCHSGSALDLPYVYDINDNNETSLLSDFLMDVADRFIDADRGFKADDLIRGFKNLAIGMLQNRGGQRPGPRIISSKASRADVITWSGCMDTQTSADANLGGKATGAMSYAFMKTLNEKPNQSYRELLVNIRNIIRKDFKQRPQLSSSHTINTDHQFKM